MVLGFPARENKLPLQLTPVVPKAVKWGPDSCRPAQQFHARWYLKLLAKGSRSIKNRVQGLGFKVQGLGFGFGA